MKKKTAVLCAGIMMFGVMAAMSACGAKDSGKDVGKQQEAQAEQKTGDTKNSDKTEEPKDDTPDSQGMEYVMTAVYLKDDNKNEMFVELKTEMPFYSTVPEGELYDEEGNKISKEDLKNGDVLEITGNGMIAESYPAQYHGIYKMQRTEKENTEYVNSYMHLLEQFTVKEDPSQIPYLDITYRQPEAVVTMIVQSTGGYTWSYEDENGQTQTFTVDCAHILQWEDISEANISEATDIELMFSKTPEKLTVSEYDASQKKEKDDSSAVSEEAGEVKVTKNADENYVLTAKPDKIYLVEAKWENGEAQYGFQTKNSKKQ